MVYGTLYKATNAGDELRGRAILPAKFVEYYNLDIELSDPDSHFPSEYPIRAIPAFRYEDGDILTKSIPISFLLANLLPEKGTILGDGSEADKARILSWMNIFNNEITTKGLRVMGQMLAGNLPKNKHEFEQASKFLDAEALVLNEYLTHHTYLVGEAVSLADLYSAPLFVRALKFFWGPNERAKYPSVVRWFSTIISHPLFGGFFDKLEYAKEPLAPDFSSVA